MKPALGALGGKMIILRVTVLRLLVLQLLLAVSTAVAGAQQFAPNGPENSVVPEWGCKQGLVNVRGKCVAVQIPQNAELNVLGNGWDCKRGFQNVGDKCIPVQIPQNAELNLLGHGWDCKRGFQNAGDKCVPVQIPQNAELNVLGHGWDCKRGFHNAGGKCVPVQIPQNAELNALGNGWDCKNGFKRVEAGCLTMSPSELVAHNRMISEVMARRNRVLRSGSTYTSERGAEFSIRVNDADLNCREGFSNGYDHCDVEVHYIITTNYNGNNDPSVRVRCEAEVAYTDETGWRGSKSEDGSKSFYVYGQSYRGEMDIDISFYDSATRVSLTDVTCRVVSVD